DSANSAAGPRCVTESALGGRESVRVDVSPHEPLSVCDGDRLCAAVDAELCEQSLDVGRDSRRADNELEGDLALVSALREQSEYLPLSQRQRRERGIAVFARRFATVIVAVTGP